MYTTPRIALAMFIMVFVGVVRGLWGSISASALCFQFPPPMSPARYPALQEFPISSQILDGKREDRCVKQAAFLQQNRALFTHLEW